MKEISHSPTIKILLILFFTIPYAIFFYFFKFSPQIELDEFFWVMKNSLLQSLLAAGVVTLLAPVAVQGLFQLPDWWRIKVKNLLIIPYILPTLFTILIAFSYINPYPMGSVGICIIFIIINLGFCSVQLFQAVSEKLCTLSSISEIYGLSYFSFLRQVYLPVLRRDLEICFFTVFVFSFTSFSVPLIVGGGKGTNLEVLIYEKIFIEHNFSVALSFCLLQALAVFLLSKSFLKSRPFNTENSTPGRYLKSPIGLGLVLSYLFLYLAGYLAAVIHSLTYSEFILQYISEIINATVFTATSLFFFILLNLCILFLFLYDYLENYEFGSVLNLIYFSTVMAGFSVYLALPADAEYDTLKAVYLGSLLFFPILFKLYLQNPINGLKQQIVTARIYGFSKTRIIFNVIFLQIKTPLFTWLSLLSVWFISEYAVFKAAGLQTKTLGLLAESFLGSYRLPAAYLMSLYILVFWFLILCFLYISLRVLYASYKKFIL